MYRQGGAAPGNRPLLARAASRVTGTLRHFAYHLPGGFKGLAGSSRDWQGGLPMGMLIPAFNEERLLGETLCQISRALTVFERRQWETELIVCDNHSTDRTADVARNAGARVVLEPVNQIALARNCGAAAATGDWLIFVDADSHPGTDLMEDVAVRIESGRCLAGGAVVRLDGQQRSANWVAHLWNGTSRALGSVAGSFVFCETRAFRATGGFSSEWFACEPLFNYGSGRIPVDGPGQSGTSFRPAGTMGPRMVEIQARPNNPPPSPMRTMPRLTSVIAAACLIIAFPPASARAESAAGVTDVDLLLAGQHNRFDSARHVSYERRVDF